jgi:hypothetical protein
MLRAANARLLDQAIGSSAARPEGQQEAMLPAVKGTAFAARFARPCRAALECRSAPAGWQ